jgi:predicted ribosomally synthesized peptide with nif11-like leader
LYQKVTADPNLRSKFNTVIQDAEKVGTAETEKKLLDFAKDAGYDISLAEMQEFFNDMSEKSSGELSDSELDMVAGGKSGGDGTDGSNHMYSFNAASKKRYCSRID